MELAADRFFCSMTQGRIAGACSARRRGRNRCRASRCVGIWPFGWHSGIPVSQNNCSLRVVEMYFVGIPKVRTINNKGVTAQARGTLGATESTDCPLKEDVWCAGHDETSPCRREFLCLVVWFHVECCCSLRGFHIVSKTWGFCCTRQHISSTNIGHKKLWFLRLLL